jgi:hypothetical protein
LAQSELGDVYKVSIRLNPDDKTKVDGINVKRRSCVGVRVMMPINAYSRRRMTKYYQSLST